MTIIMLYVDEFFKKLYKPPVSSYVAVNMTLLAFAADRRAAVAAPAADACTVQQLIDIDYPRGPQQQTHRASCGGRRDRQTDGYRIVT